MNFSNSRQLIARAALAILIAFLFTTVIGDRVLDGLSNDNVACAASNSLYDTLLAQANDHQVIQFNPDAALQKRIFNDGFVPNSSEIALSFQGTDYAAQRAENLGTGVVRVYFVRIGDWGNVQYTTGGDTLGDLLLAKAQTKQVMQFNPSAALQKGIFADRFVPNSPEFGAQVDGVSYSVQRAENLGNGQVRAYLVAVGDWANVRNTDQAVQEPSPVQQPAAPILSTLPSQAQPRSQPPAISSSTNPVRPAGCCKVCTVGKPCGNSCISRSYTCHQPPGCACAG